MRDGICKFCPSPPQHRHPTLLPARYIFASTSLFYRFYRKIAANMSFELFEGDTQKVRIPLKLTPRQQPRPTPYNQGYLPNGASGPVPGATPLLPNQGRVIQSGPIRVLCIADVRGANTQQLPKPRSLHLLTMDTQATSAPSTTSPGRLVRTTSSTPAISASTMRHPSTASLKSELTWKPGHDAC